MSNYAEYFEKNRYKATWSIGDRVFGKYNKIPFVGSVGNDTLINELEGPRVSIHLDLPMLINGVRRDIVIVKPTDIKRLKPLEEIQPVNTTVKKSKSNGKEKGRKTKV